MPDDASRDASKGTNVEEERTDKSMAEGRRAKLSVGQVEDKTENEKETKQNRGFKEEESEHEQSNSIFRGDHLGDILSQAYKEGISKIGSADEPKDVPKVTKDAEEARCILHVILPEPYNSRCENEEDHLHDDCGMTDMCRIM